VTGLRKSLIPPETGKNRDIILVI